MIYRSSEQYSVCHPNGDSFLLLQKVIIYISSDLKETTFVQNLIRPDIYDRQLFRLKISSRKENLYKLKYILPTTESCLRTYFFFFPCVFLFIHFVSLIYIRVNSFIRLRNLCRLLF